MTQKIITPITKGIQPPWAILTRLAPKNAKSNTIKEKTKGTD